MTISNEEYTNRVKSRASIGFYANLLRLPTLVKAMSDMRRAGEAIDVEKKALFYGRSNGRPRLAFMPPVIEGMAQTDQTIMHGVMGIASETAEVLEQYLNFIEMGEPLDMVSIQEELGDLLWYITLLADATGTSLSRLMQQNDAKLEKRFGAVFSEDRANHRNLVEERKTLEDNS